MLSKTLCCAGAAAFLLSAAPSAPAQARKPDVIVILADDLGELHNIAPTHPAEVARMEAEIAAWNETLVKPQWPQSKHSTVDFDGQSLGLFY
ncbi:MAG: hypothetical protein WAU49_13565 [Steroidobacteraceae bacterium]